MIIFEHIVVFGIWGYSEAWFWLQKTTCTVEMQRKQCYGSKYRYHGIQRQVTQKDPMAL
jgi:hypothetical protein